MANAFSTEEIVAFEQILAGFEDALVLSRHVSTVVTDMTQLARAGDTIWRPMPYILPSYSGLDQTSNFGDRTQLSVPASMTTPVAVPWQMTSQELRDALQSERLASAARQRLASDINVAIQNRICNEATLVVKQTTAAAGFADVSLAEAIMNEQGVPMNDRYMALSTRDYNGMAKDLGNRSQVQGIVQKAYEQAYVGRIASFDLYKLDYANSLTAKTAATVTVNGANQYHTPAATSSGDNVDNRTQSLAVTVGSGTIAVGDCFTIEGVNAVHQITKGDTGQLKTFRVRAIVSGAGGTGTITISPPIVSNGGSTAAELQYKNVTATPASGAAITFLNTVTASINPFWHKDAIELIPGRLAIPMDAGVAVMRATTESKIEVVMQKFFDINTSKIKFRLDTFFGTVCTNPEMCGLILFSQS